MKLIVERGINGQTNSVSGRVTMMRLQRAIVGLVRHRWGALERNLGLKDKLYKGQTDKSQADEEGMKQRRTQLVILRQWCSHYVLSDVWLVSLVEEFG